MPGDAYLIRDGRTYRLPTKHDNLRLVLGDRIIVRTGGGGGYGPPWEREVEMVARDVARGLVSPKTARAEYGVVLGPDGLTPDAAATVALRREMAARRAVRPVDRGTVRAGPPPGRLVEVEGIPEV